jgi:hypothetical protein
MRSGDPVVILAAGVNGQRSALAPPEDLIDVDGPEDDGVFLRPIVIDVGDLRQNPEEALEALR